MNYFVRQIRRILLFLGDLAILYSVLLLVLLLRYPDSFSADVWNQHLLPFTVIFALWLLVFYISGLYDPRETKNDINFYTLVFRTMLLNALIGLIYFYIFSDRTFTIKPQVVFVVFLAFFSVIFLFWRRLYNHFVARERFLKNVLFIGTGPDMTALVQELQRKPHFGYHVSDFIQTGDRAGAGLAESLKNLDLSHALVSKKIEVVVMSPEVHQSPEVVDQFYRNLFLGISYLDLPTFYEKITGRIPIATIGQLWFLENITENDKKFYEIFKRLLDIVVSLPLALLTLVLTPFIAAAIKLDSPGPIFFKQLRIGKDGRQYLAVKFRSMITDSEKNGPQWTQKQDMRITRAGRVLRKLKLDEFPQTMNILRGEMSLIGPRPEQPEFVEERTRSVPYYNERHLIKPGITGWAQINAPFTSASETDTITKLQYDLYYIKNRSILLDLGIILKTINIMVTRQGR